MSSPDATSPNAAYGLVTDFSAKRIGTTSRVDRPEKSSMCVLIPSLSASKPKIGWHNMKQTSDAVITTLTTSGLIPADTTKNFCMYVLNV